MKISLNELNISLIRAFHLSWKVLLYLIIIRAFHLSVGKPYWYCSVYYYYSLKKKNLHLIIYRKTIYTITLDLLTKSLSPLLYSWTLTSYELIDTLRKILVIGLSQKQLSLHPWKFWCTTIICWKYWYFVLRVRWPIKELLPLKL